MIKGFKDQTQPLNDYEQNKLLPIVIMGLREKKGKENAVTSHYIVKSLKKLDYKIDGPRLRKIINHIRTNDMILGLIATSDGYYIAGSESDLKDYEESLLGREEAIRKVRESINRHRKMLFGQPPRTQTQQLAFF